MPAIYLLQTNLKCPMLAKFIITTAPYRNVSTELWFEGDEYTQGISSGVILAFKTWSQYTRFCLVYNFPFSVVPRLIIYLYIIIICNWYVPLIGSKEQHGRKGCSATTQCWLHRVRIQNRPYMQRKKEATFFSASWPNSRNCVGATIFLPPQHLECLQINYLF